MKMSNAGSCNLLSYHSLALSRPLSHLHNHDVVVFGGSVSAGHGAAHLFRSYGELITEWLSNKFQLNLVFHNRAIPSCGPLLPSLCFSSLTKDLRPAIIFAEYSMNSDTETSFLDLLKRIRGHFPTSIVYYVDTFSLQDANSHSPPVIPHCVSNNAVIASRSGLPVLSVGGALTGSESLKPELFFAPDAIHLNQQGHHFVADLFKQVIDVDTGRIHYSYSYSTNNTEHFIYNSDTCFAVHVPRHHHITYCLNILGQSSSCSCSGCTCSEEFKFNCTNGTMDIDSTLNILPEPALISETGWLKGPVAGHWKYAFQPMTSSNQSIGSCATFELKIDDGSTLGVVRMVNKYPNHNGVVSVAWNGQFVGLVDGWANTPHNYAATETFDVRKYASGSATHSSQRLTTRKVFENGSYSDDVKRTLKEVSRHLRKVSRTECRFAGLGYGAGRAE